MNAWRGIIDKFADRLPVTKSTPVISLGEGNTPLTFAERLSAKVGANVWLKFDGANPTGSFKDRGMTLAISKAAESGDKAVICASTGNTSASAAAYAAKAGMRCVVLIPDGKIPTGKLAQAIIYGAQVLQIRGNFDDALQMARSLSETSPITLVNSVNQYRIDGQMTGAWEVVNSLGTAPHIHCIPVGNAGNITAYWRGYKLDHKEGLTKVLPRMFGFQASESAPMVLGHDIDDPKTIASAIQIGKPASRAYALEALEESNGVINAVTDEQILDAYRWLGANEGIYCEPASAASVAGLLAYGIPKELSPDSNVVCTLTGHGLKDSGIVVGELEAGRLRSPDQIDATLDAIRRAIKI